MGASPELLAAKQNENIFSHPVAGTLIRREDHAEDQAQAERLLASAKDQYEHSLVIEAIADQLAPLCKTLTIPKSPSLIKTQTLWHLATPIQGKLKDPELHIFDLVSILHPTPAVCGQPAQLARTLISELEPFQRNLFAGTMGWSDAHGNGAWSVNVRCGRICDQSARLYAGAGLSPALFLLDIMLPGESGNDILDKLRKTQQYKTLPVIMLTAKGEIEDRIIGLELGADDYLIKPFSPRELVARVRALFRRAHQADEPAVEVLDFGDLVIDISGHKILVEGKEVDLTASEFKLLTTLARHPGRVYNRMELVEKVLGYDFEGYERTIDSHVKNLRAKLGDDPKKPKWLYTVHGVGYRFEAPTKTDKSDEK